MGGPEFKNILPEFSFPTLLDDFQGNDKFYLRVLTTTAAVGMISRAVESMGFTEAKCKMYTNRKLWCGFLGMG